MPRRSALASTSAARAASSFGKPKCRKTRVLNSSNASMGNTWASTLAIVGPFSSSAGLGKLRRQRLSSRLRPKRKKQQAHRERQRSQRYGHAQRAVVPHAGAHQKRDSRSSEPRKGSGKRKRAGAAFGRILLRKPQGVHGEIRAAKSQKEQTHKKPEKRAGADIEKFSERHCDENQHQGKIHGQRAAASQALGKPRHRQATQNRRKRDQHGGARSKLRRLRSRAPRGLRKGCHCCRHVYRSRPEPANRSQHKQCIEDGALAPRSREQRRKRTPHRPRPHYAFLLHPARRFPHAVPHPRQQQRRQASEDKHRAPSIAASDQIIHNRGEKYAHVITGVHVTRARFSAALRPLLRHERATHGPLPADSDSGEQTQRRQLPNAGDQRAKKREYRIPGDGDHQRADAPEFIGYRAPQKGQPPTHQEQGEQQSAIKSDIALGGGDSRARQELTQRGHENERVDERIHAIKCPAAPGRPKAANLVLIEPLFGKFGGVCSGGHASGDYIIVTPDARHTRAGKNKWSSRIQWRSQTRESTIAAVSARSALHNSRQGAPPRS